MRAALLGAIAVPVIVAASLGEEVAEREPMAIDRATLIAATPHASGLWHGAMVGFSDVGAGLVPVLVASIAVTVTLHRRMRRHALFVVLAVEGATVGGRLLKAAFERARPARARRSASAAGP